MNQLEFQELLRIFRKGKLGKVGTIYMRMVIAERQGKGIRLSCEDLRTLIASDVHAIHQAILDEIERDYDEGEGE